MEFKIDTKESFSVITPLDTDIDAILAGELVQQCNNLRQIGSNNYIIDLQFVKEIDNLALAELISLNKIVYDLNGSIVFTCTNNHVLSSFKKEETDLVLNIAPRMDEAIDIVSMEILERDLMKDG